MGIKKEYRNRWNQMRNPRYCSSLTWERGESVCGVCASSRENLLKKTHTCGGCVLPKMTFKCSFVISYATFDLFIPRLIIENKNIRERTQHIDYKVNNRLEEEKNLTTLGQKYPFQLIFPSLVLSSPFSFLFHCPDNSGFLRFITFLQFLHWFSSNFLCLKCSSYGWMREFCNFKGILFLLISHPN